MSRYLYAAVIEDDKSRSYQFHAYSEEELDAQLAAWCRPRWPEEFGECPADDGECYVAYFENMCGPPFVPMGFEHTLTALEAILVTPEEGTPRSYMPSVLSECDGNACYPMELYVNGELSFKLESEDATGDLRAIKALMRMRTSARENKPLTNMELYGVDHPEAMIFTAASGEKFHIQKDGSLRQPEGEQS